MDGDPAAPAPWRPGSYVERTSMAWVRTSLSMLAVSGAEVRLGAFEQHWPVMALGGLGAALSVAMIAISAVRYRRTGGPQPAERLDARSRLSAGLAAGAVACLGVAALVLGCLAL